MMFEKKVVENMKDGKEMGMVLGQITHATSSFNLYPTANQQHSNLVDHGYGHTSFMAQNMNGHGNGEGHVHGMYDELLKHNYGCASSPVNGSSSSLFSHGGHSLGSSSPPRHEEFKPHLIPANGVCLGLKNSNESDLLDNHNLSGNFSNMYISSEHSSFPQLLNGTQSCNRSLNGANLMNLEKYGASDNYMQGSSDRGRFYGYVLRGPMNYEGEASPVLVQTQHDQQTQHDHTVANLSRSQYSPSPSMELFSRADFGNSASRPQFCTTKMSYPTGFVVPDVSPTSNRPSVGDIYRYALQNGTNLIESRDAFYSPQLARFMPHYSKQHVLQGQPSVHNGRNKVPLQVRVSQGSIEAFTREDGLIIQGEGMMNLGLNRVNERSGGHYNVQGLLHHENGGVKLQEKRSQLDSRSHYVANQDNCRSPKMFFPFSMQSKCSFLAESQGYIYNMATDQHGCRFLQRIFDEGTSQDMQMIFEEIIDHVVELMMNPFGNYLMQKFLEKCHESQRRRILMRVTEKPGELVRISLNTHGTRVVQKLIETLKKREEISLVIEALEPGFISLIEDLNGNHVVQRCLQCFTTEDSKFIFVAATKYCVAIARHQHGCCVLQRCIDHSSGQLRDDLIAEISANGLLLAQDAFGNYVVQFILDLKIPSATSKLTSQFEGNYVHLSRQKFSSHVVEKCLVVCNDEARSRIIQELLSATYFDQLLQDPHANYVVQKALLVSEGSLFNSLVDAIESHKAISRNSPYSKRIFSHKLLKR